MSLASRISTLASRIGLEVKAKIDATHPGLARAWVSFGYVGTQVVIFASFNVASVTRIATGRYRVNFTTAMRDANYCWTALARSNASSGQQRMVIVRTGTELKTVQYVEVACSTAAAALDDSAEINVVVYR
jgi:hypothetical protein